MLKPCELFSANCSDTMDYLRHNHSEFCELLYIVGIAFYQIPCSALPTVDDLYQKHCQGCIVYPIMGSVNRLKFLDGNIYGKTFNHIYTQEEHKYVCFHQSNQLEYLDLSDNVYWVQDVFGDYQQETIKQKYKVTCDILFYNGLRTAIPRSWLAKINDEINLVGIVANSEQLLTVIIKNNRIDLRRVKCSQVYWSEINKIMERSTCYYKWESEYFYATFDWDLINVIPYECTTETFLQSLQFKIIHRYFPCNYRLHLWNIVEDSKCTYC